MVTSTYIQMNGVHKNLYIAVYDITVMKILNCDN